MISNLQRKNWGEMSVYRLGCVLLCLLFCSPTAAGWTENLQVRPIRSVKLITQDEAGLPIRFPASLAYDPLEDEIYLVSPLKNKLVVLTADFFPYLSIGAGRGLNSISGSFLKDGKLYVCLGASETEPRPHIAVYDGAFLPRQKIYFPNLPGFSPLAMVVGTTGNLYVVGQNGSGVVVLDPQGRYLRTIEPLDEVLGVKEKASILAIDIDSAGRLYFVSESMGRVYVYDQNERYLYKFGEKGGEPGKLSRPRGIAIDEFRRQVYLVDYQRHTVSVYAVSGEYLFEIGGLGQGRGWFYYPNDIIVDGQGRLLVADTFNHRIQVFEFVGGLPPIYGEPGERIAGQAGRPEPFAAEPVAEAELIAIGHIDVDLQADAVGDYLVLTSISRDESSAQQLADKLRSKGYPVHIQPLDRGARGVWQQVLVGPYGDPLEGYRVAEQLRSEELLPALLKTRGEATELRIPAAQSETPASTGGEPVADNLQIKSTQSAATDSALPVKEPVAEPVDEGKSGLARDSGGIHPDGKVVTPSLEEMAGEQLFEIAPPNDQVHSAIHALPRSNARAAVIQSSKKDLPAPAPQDPPRQDAQTILLPVPTAAAATPERIAAPAPTIQGKSAAVIKVDFCVKCHGQRVAKVCMQCHPRDRRDRI